MFKKIINIALALLLFVSTTGFTISKHYCGEHLISVTINSEANACCDDAMGGCCHEETKHFQLEDNFVSADFIVNLEETCVIDLMLLPPSEINFNYWTELDSKPLALIDYPPPPDIHTVLSKLQTYLL